MRLPLAFLPISANRPGPLLMVLIGDAERSAKRVGGEAVKIERESNTTFTK